MAETDAIHRYGLSFWKNDQYELVDEFDGIHQLESSQFIGAKGGTKYGQTTSMCLVESENDEDDIGSALEIYRSDHNYGIRIVISDRDRDEAVVSHCTLPTEMMVELVNTIEDAEGMRQR